MTDIQKLLKINNNGKVKLFHGSRGGIDGNIAPISRARCDFGKGFYMGSHPMQAKSLVSGDDSPFFYELELDISKIPDKKIWIPDDEEWIHLVLSHRKNIDFYNELPIAHETQDKAKEYDLIIGKIADDKMRQAMNSFMDNGLTDAGLLYCLQYVKYGVQVVAKTAFACRNIRIIKEIALKGNELDQAVDYSQELQKQCVGVVNYAQMEFADKGKRLSDIIKEQRIANQKEPDEIKKSARRLFSNSKHSLKSDKSHNSRLKL